MRSRNTLEFEQLLARYDYSFPKRLIAQAPASPRDSAKLLVYEKKSKKVSFDVFRNLGKYLQKGAVLVLNETKVVPARLTLRKKDTGGAVRVLYLETEGKLIRVLADRKLLVGAELILKNSLSFTVVARKNGEYLLRPPFSVARFPKLLEQYGETPLPPYIKHSPLTERERKLQYQTIFARRAGSIAAPTASLHFTKRLLLSLKKQGITLVYVTLHVHLGTFAPLTESQWKSGRLHKEYYSIAPTAARVLQKAKKEGRPIIAVGTTVARTLEFTATSRGELHKLEGATDLFIKEGYHFKMVDGLITNFHVPRSSLLMLVGAFTGRDTVLDLYAKALRKKFRLFSFGDGMLIY